MHIHRAILGCCLLLTTTILSVVQTQDTEKPELIPKLAGYFSSPCEPMTNTGPPPLRPPQVPLDVDNYPVAPQGLTLEQVHLYIRHGERTPVGVRLADPPASIPAHWVLCKMARQFRASVAAHLTEEHLDFQHFRKIVERADGSSSEGECLLGELTDIGRQSTHHFGQSLRKLYIDKLGLLPDILKDKDAVYLRTTNIPRTTESLQQIIQGLYPSSKCQCTPMPSILVRNGQDENLLGNTYSCKRLELLKLGFAQAAVTAYNPTLEALDKRIAKYMPGGQGIRLDGKPRASGVLDTIRAATAHGVKVPPEFEEKPIIDVIEKAVVNEWFSGYKTEEVRRLGMGRLLDEMSQKMHRKVAHGSSDPLKMLVHSTHDTALAGLAATLDVYDEKWPAFTSSLTFELFSNKSENATIGSTGSYVQRILSPFQTQKTEYFIRLRYMNKTLPLPFCEENGKHLPGSPEFCTLQAFTARVKELTPKDWDEECKVPAI